MQGLTARPSFYRHALLSAPTRVLQLSTNWRGSCQDVHLQKIAQTIEFPQKVQVELLTADTSFCPLTAMPDTQQHTMVREDHCNGAAVESTETSTFVAGNYPAALWDSIHGMMKRRSSSTRAARRATTSCSSSS